MTPAFLGLVLIINYNIIFVLCIPLLVLGVFACVLAAKSGKLFFSAGLIIAFFIAGLAFPVWLATTISGKSAGETVSEYVQTRINDTAIINLAKNYVYDTEVADALSFTFGVTPEEVRRDVALAVGAMDVDEVLARYGAHLRETINFEVLFFVFSTGAMLAMTAFLLLTLLILSYQHLVKKSDPPPFLHKTVYDMTHPRHFIMPRRYASYILAPYILMFMLRGAVPLCKTLFDATYYGMILVPFGFAGVGLLYYLFGRLKLNLGYSSLIAGGLLLFAILGVQVVFLLLSCVGVVDYFLNVRFIIEHYGKPINKEKKNEGNF